MAVAIKATATLSYYSAIKQYSDWRRPGMERTCPICGERFLVYFGPEMTERETRNWFRYRASLDHPHTDDGFADLELFPMAEELAS